MAFRTLAACVFLASAVATSQLQGARPAETAAELDRLFSAEAAPKTPAPISSDTTFLRRVSMDLVGEQPTPEEVTAFALDASTDKRHRAIERLLANPHFGQNWGRYWRDVILSRRIDDRALFLSSNSLTVFMTEQYNNAAGWDEIASACITATGDVRRNGAAGLIMAQEGKAEETAAEVSRIFLGVQIQCAQCHDHPYDAWTREQFHELAAFFPRTLVRPKINSTTRTFEVASFERRFGRHPGGNQGSASLEHYMPDVDDPQADGTLMRPVFFLSGDRLETGDSDLDRRNTLAQWITGDDNPWFAKAYINRIWSELIGRGFYEPIDDMGPDRDCLAPKTLEYLSEQFAAADYDVKWLFRVIMNTQAYQRASRSRPQAAQGPLASSCPQPLRADQLFNALTAALGLAEQTTRGGYGGRGVQSNAVRLQFSQTFGYDPSVSRDEVTASIPQALMLMNSPQINAAISGRGGRTLLGKLLDDEKDDELVATELYLRCLAREPSDKELKTCLQYVRETKDRTEAFEDILWALINSAEFRLRN